MIDKEVWTRGLLAKFPAFSAFWPDAVILEWLRMFDRLLTWGATLEKADFLPVLGWGEDGYAE